jgi:hypothetical protein
MKIETDLDETQLLKTDALGYLCLSNVHVFTHSSAKLRFIKQLVPSVSYFEWNSARSTHNVDNQRTYIYSISQIVSLAFLEELKDIFAESFLTYFFLALGSRDLNHRFKLRFFRLSSDNSSSNDIQDEATLEESALVIKMEKYIRPRLFDMMNLGRHSCCFIVIEFDETLIATIHVNIDNGQLLLRLLDQHYEEIRMRSSSHQTIVNSNYLVKSDGREPRFEKNS